ncbi:MAG: DUF3616 domain-containing protein [Cyanobacteria bacterium RM1_2_2]|nr:DUF3616 domain-containing protein [Cyanobacteria bacterium RM1_2_2]
MSEPFLLNRVLLRFGQQAEELLNNLSAIQLTPDGSLWLGSDELGLVGTDECNTLDRLSLQKPGIFGDHALFRVRDFIDLSDQVGEIDIEGLDYADSYLWLTGSHSTKRKKPKGKNLEKDIQRLAEIETDSNRFLIARIPLVAGQLHKCCSVPDRPSQELTAACLRRDNLGNQLMTALQTDPHLGSYIAARLPSKENGFDVEGIAVRQNRLFLGLRGPVLRSWAMLLEIVLTETTAGELQLEPIGDTEQLYRKHFLELDGLGVRDLCFHGDDLLILAGPTMDLTGSQGVYRWHDAVHRSEHTVCSQAGGELELLFNLPYSATGDKAEGMTLFPSLGEVGLLIVYDSPNADRIVDTRDIYADVFRLPAHSPD